MFNFNSTLLKTSVFTSQEKPTSVHQLLNHNYSQKAQAASPLKRFLNMCVCPRDSVCPALLRRILAGMVLHPPTPSCNRRYLPPVSPWSRLLKQDLKQRATLTSYFVFFHKIQHSILSLFTSLSSQKNIQAVRHSSLSSMPQVQPSRTAQSCKKLKCHCQGQRGGVQSGSTNATSSYRVQNWTNPFVWKKRKKKG